MVLLTENSLSKRQQELNYKVNQAAVLNTNFDKVKEQPDTNDVDRLYKIDLAAIYKNTEYIIETLKSGDPLYISRVLRKSHWLYNDEYSNIVNTDYLHQHIFPLMSIKMKKKFLTTFLTYLKNEERAAEFYQYCKQVQMPDLAYKFLVHTSDSYKLKLLQDRDDKIFDRDNKYLKCFFGESFEIFKAYLDYLDGNGWNKHEILGYCSYLYTISDVQYLDLLEKHSNVDLLRNHGLKLGLRISKNIVIKHKDRVLKNPMLYVNILNLGKLLRHSALSDVKVYAVGVLPKEVSQFWDINYYRKYKPIIHAVPEDERYAFLKKIFTENYVNEEFEMLRQFYDQKYYTLMTEGEREAWALRHIAENKEIFGSGLDYVWYQFLSFDKAFEDVKKLIRTATDQGKRIELLKVLIVSCKSHSELDTLFKYYYERHSNESKSSKEVFLRKVIAIHDVIKFEGDCWESFNKIFYSVDVYNKGATRCNPDFKIVSILHHILNNKPMPDSLKQHLEFEISMYSLKQYSKPLDEEKKEQVYKYILDFYLENIQKYVPGSENDKCIAQIHFSLELLASFGKTKEDVPEAIMEFVNRDFETYRRQQIFHEQPQEALTDDHLVRYLKEDSKLLTVKFPEVTAQMKVCYYFRLNRLLRKLKVYFSDDEVTQHYLKVFHDLLDQEEVSYKMVYTSVYGILQLSNEKAVIDFMTKFAPTDPKIDYKEPNILRIREAICRFAGYSRPPVPLSNILMYLKGDYVHFCLPMLNMYLRNLPQPQCLKFVEQLLDAPVKIQKHGIRLAFKCFTTEDLTKLVQDVWKDTKNVSLRGVMYNLYLDKTVEKKEKQMYEILKSLTLDLHEEDKDDIFCKLTSNKLPDDWAGDFIMAVWTTVQKFKDNEENVKRKTDVIKRIDSLLYLLEKDWVKQIVSDHLNTMFTTKTGSNADNKSSLHVAKWDLLAHYIVYFTSNDEDRLECVEMAKFVLSKCLEGWNDAISGLVFGKFIANLKQLRFVPDPNNPPCLLADVKSFVNASCIFEAILEALHSTLPLHDIYIYVWELRITIIHRQIVKESDQDDENREEIVTQAATKYGKQIGNLVKEFMDKKIYFPRFTDKIADFINDTAFQMKYYLGVKRLPNLEPDHIIVAIAQGLLKTETVETDLLALQMLPKDPRCSLDYFKSVYDVIRKRPDLETQCCLHEKYSSKRKRFE